MGRRNRGPQESIDKLTNQLNHVSGLVNWNLDIIGRNEVDLYALRAAAHRLSRELGKLGRDAPEERPRFRTYVITELDEGSS